MPEKTFTVTLKELQQFQTYAGQIHMWQLSFYPPYVWTEVRQKSFVEKCGMAWEN